MQFHYHLFLADSNGNNAEMNAPLQIDVLVQQALREAYGIEGLLTRLPGENLNYLVEAGSGLKYIAKIAGNETPSEVVEMEHAAIQHAVQARLGIQLPQILVNNYGNLETGINNHSIASKRLRILKYIEGVNLSDITDISDNLRSNLGKCLAGFDLAMAGFDHPKAHRAHRWDLAGAAQHKAKIALVQEPERRDLLRWAFGQITNNVSSVFPRLRWQFIHGDANPENIRVNRERIVGMIDLGDSCYNPLVCDLAICLAYQMMDQVNPWAVAACIIDGYESILPLAGEEQAILFPLVCGRLAVSLSIAAERRQIDPDNRNWYVSEIPAWRLLMRLRASGKTHLSGAASGGYAPVG